LTKFNATRRKRIVQAIRAGNYASTAFAWAGISETQYYTWLKRGREAIEQGKTTDHYAIFYQEVEEAKAAAEVHNVAVIQKAAEKQWQASAWMLERRHPDRWGRNDKHRVEMKGEIEIDDTASAKRTLESLLDGIAERLRESESDRGDERG